VGNEQQFIRLLRQLRDDIGTSASQAVFSLGRKVTETRAENPDFDQLLIQCSEAFARGEIESGATLLSKIIRAIPHDNGHQGMWRVLLECATVLEKFEVSRVEYLVLVFDILDAL
jgi:hypothetical protein